MTTPLTTGLLRMGSKIIDFNELEIRSVLTDQQIQQMYNQFLQDIPSIEENFDEPNALRETLDEITTELKPAVFARKPKYPLFWPARTAGLIGVKKEKIRVADQYFVDSRLLSLAPNTLSDNTKYLFSPNLVFDKELEDKFEGIPNTKACIEIPDDFSITRAKVDTYYGGLRLLLQQYALNTFTSRPYQDAHEQFFLKLSSCKARETLLVDQLLQSDKQAHLQHKWDVYTRLSLEGNKLRHNTKSLAAITTGALLGFGLSHPMLLLGTPLPILAGNYYLKKKRKQLEKTELALSLQGGPYKI